MARLFDDASSEYLDYNGAILDAVPLTMASWFFIDVNSLYLCLMSIASSAHNDERFILALAGQRGAPDADSVEAVTDSGGGTFYRANTSAAWSTNTWHHAAGVFSAADSRAVYLDGGSKGTDSNSGVPSSLNNTAIGRLGDSTPSTYMSGRIAELGLWNVALTDAEVAILAAGYSPLFVRPQSLVAYWPLIRDEDQDRVGGYDMTPVNTPSVAEHPPIIYPATPYIVVPAAGAPPAANIPEFMHHYQQQQQAG